MESSVIDSTIMRHVDNRRTRRSFRNLQLPLPATM